MIQRILHHKRAKQQSGADRPEMIQRWVETADERCPLACAWFALPGILDDQPAAGQGDEPDANSLPSPCSLRRQAVCIPFTFFLHHLPDWLTL